MNKSPQYNQQAKPKHSESEVEEIFIQHIKTWKLVIAASISDGLKINTVKWATLNSRATLNSHTFSMETH